MAKNNSSARANKGKTGFNTPSRWAHDRPEQLKKNAGQFKGKIGRDRDLQHKTYFVKPW